MSEIQREVERAETVQPGEGKAQGGKYQMRGVKKRESRFPQWNSVAGQEAMGTN